MNEYAQKKIGTHIRKLRNEKKITLEVLAERANMSSNFLWEIEAGRKNPSAKFIIGIAHALDVSLDFLVTGEDIYEGFGSIISLLKVCTPRQLKVIESIISRVLEMREL